MHCGKLSPVQFVYTLLSPEGNASVAPDMGVFEVTYKLDALIQAHGVCFGALNT
jgi:hypothetical protein